MEIRPFEARHLRGVRDLIVPIQRQEFEIPITYEEQPDLRDIDGFYRHGHGEFWIAEEGDDVVGSIALLDIGNGQGALRKMFVHADYRGSKHGTARALLDRLLAHARSGGLIELYLGTTAAFHAAHRFYEKAGFQQIAVAELPEDFPRMAVDTRFYRLTLSRSGS